MDERTVSTENELRPYRSWQITLHEIIFEADTKGGKIFDVGLIVCIGLIVLDDCGNVTVKLLVLVHHRDHLGRKRKTAVFDVKAEIRVPNEDSFQQDRITGGYSEGRTRPAISQGMNEYREVELNRQGKIRLERRMIGRQPPVLCADLTHRAQTT